MKRTGRIIINIGEGVSDSDAVDFVKRVIDDGKVSAEGESYCYLTIFRVVYPDGVNRRFAVNTDKPSDKGTHTFYVLREEDEGAVPTG